MQIATFEVLLSLIVAMSIVSLTLSIYNRRLSSIYQSEKAITGSMLAYDLFVQANENSTLFNCLQAFYYSNSSCIARFLDIYKEEYRVSGIEVMLNNREYGDVANATAKSCTVLNGSTFCIEVS